MKSFLFNSPVIGYGLVELEDMDSRHWMKVERILAPAPEFRSCAGHPELINNPVGAIDGDLGWYSTSNRKVPIFGEGQYLEAAQMAIQQLEDAYRLHVCWAAHAPRGQSDQFRARTVEEAVGHDRSSLSLATREWLRISAIKAGKRPLAETKKDFGMGWDVAELAAEHFRQETTAA